MTTFKQINANRRNAEKNTGPKTPEGKAISSMNAQKTGLDLAPELMKQESQDEYKQLTADYYEQFPPANAIERALLDQLIKNEWLTRRYIPVEARIFDARLGVSGGDAGTVLLYQADDLVKLDRIRNSAQRNYHRAMKELLALRQARNAGMPIHDAKAAEAAKAAIQDQPQPEPTKPLNPELVSFHTFPETPIALSQPNPETAPPTEKPLTKAA